LNFKKYFAKKSQLSTLFAIALWWAYDDENFWTRQKTSLKKRGGEWRQKYLTISSNISWLTQLTIFFTFIAFIVGLFTEADIQSFLQALSSLFSYQ